MTSSPPNTPAPPTPDNAPPTSTITSPRAGEIVSTGTTVSIAGTASDTGGGSVARVEVSVDGGATYSSAMGTTAWSFSWSPSTPGQATIRSRAVDTSGNTQDPTAQITVTVQDKTPPTSTIMSPAPGATVFTGTTVIISGTANDTGGGSLTRVDVSVDGGATFNAATGTTAWSYTWTPTTPGQATISSRAVDNSGNMQDPPAEISVRVSLAIRVPSDQPTIQAAIDVAEIGDTVMVAPGTYTENINFKGKAITVRSESGQPGDTIINGRNPDSVVVFLSGEKRDSVLNGFTLQNGRSFQGSAHGGGVTVGAVSSPTITNNVIRNNQACTGGGISIASGSPLIQRNRITGNGGVCSGGGGGGIGIVGPTTAEILDNEISDNINPFGAGIYMFAAAPPLPSKGISSRGMLPRIREEVST